jgi:two-component system, NtrC family, response regulator AlgB
MEPAPVRVLVVDDEPNIRQTLALCLRQIGCEVAPAATGAAARELVGERAFDLALLDLRLGAEHGIDVLPALLALQPGLDVVIITAYSSIDSAVEAMRRGARDYLPKPFTPEQIRGIVERTRKRRALEEQVSHLAAAFPEMAPEPFLETASARMATALETVRRAAAHDVPVLLRGEGGTGKGVLARSLHEQSARRDRPFMVVSLLTLGEERFAAGLFGSRGAATGEERGALERAEGGTVLLDGLGGLGPDLQARLLRVLRDRRFERVGDSILRTASVRLVVATDGDLEAEVSAGRLGRDLLYQLNVIEITVPPLRERIEDVLPLARAFVVSFAEHMRRRPPELSEAAARTLLAWPWPGNVRELRNVIERALILTPGEVIEQGVFPERMLGATPGDAVTGGDFTAEEVEREHVRRVLARTATLAEASRILGMDVTTLWRKRKRWGR